MNVNIQALIYFILNISYIFSTSDIKTAGENVIDANPIMINVSWGSHDYDLHTVPTLQVVANPLLMRQSSPIHDQVFSNLKQLNAEYARYAVWYPYPKMAVAELDPPSGLLQCGNVGQDYSIDLSCEQSGGVISQIDFASYGTSSGACGQMKRGTCHAANSSEVVGDLCFGKQTCSVPAAVDLFGDPCKFHFPILSFVHNRIV